MKPLLEQIEELQQQLSEVQEILHVKHPNTTFFNSFNSQVLDSMQNVLTNHEESLGKRINDIQRLDCHCQALHKKQQHMESALELLEKGLYILGIEIVKIPDKPATKGEWVVQVMKRRKK